MMKFKWIRPALLALFMGGISLSVSCERQTEAEDTAEDVAEEIEDVAEEVD